MRIAYAVHGYGRGHATRSGAVLPFLSKENEIKLFTGGDSINLLNRWGPIQQIPILSFVYSDNKLSVVKTIRKNTNLVKNLMFGGSDFNRVVETLKEFNPDVVISDSEPLLLKAARKLDIPTIMFDHFSILLHSDLGLSFKDEVERKVLAQFYRLLMGKTHKSLVSSFYGAEGWSKEYNPALQYVGAVLGPEVFNYKPIQGEHILVYINTKSRNTSNLMKVLRECGRPVKIYPADEFKQEANITYCASNRESFLKDLSSCAAIVSSAGNQLVGESVYYGKPLVVMPEPALEQKLNRHFIEKNNFGLGTSLEEISLSHINFAIEHINPMSTKISFSKGDDLAQILLKWAQDIQAAKITWKEMF